VNEDPDGAKVHGIGLDDQTRCAHWDSPLDVIAIKMKCCRAYYACKDCHDALADHPLEPWPPEQWEQTAVLCGVCRGELTVAQYLESSDCCPACGAHFNPRCRAHRGYYFSVPNSSAGFDCTNPHEVSADN
jgi:uncharacterized CHY-type Zn-finger protein